MVDYTIGLCGHVGGAETKVLTLLRCVLLLVIMSTLNKGMKKTKTKSTLLIANCVSYPVFYAI